MNIEKYLVADYIGGLLEKGKRHDGRAFDEYRKLEIIRDYVGEKSDGSCYVRLGDTEVLCGVSMMVGSPYPDRPKSGTMTTSVELRPIAHPRFESGPPREDSIELARVIDRGIRESGSINFDGLYIEEDKIWMAMIDVHVINHAGNLIDAGAIAAAAALSNTRMPKYEDGNAIRGEWEGKLDFGTAPMPVTFSKIGSSIILDADLMEENALDARLTVTTTETLNAMQKGGNGVFTASEVKDCVRRAFEIGQDMRGLL